MVILDPASARVFTSSIQTLQRDIHREWHRDEYDCWTVDRSPGWADSTAIEAQALVESGMGKIYPNGAGRPQAGEMVIHLESPYRFRTQATSTIAAGNLLVVNGERLFRVDATKPGEGDAILMDVFLSELFSTPMPGGM